MNIPKAANQKPWPGRPGWPWLLLIVLLALSMLATACGSPAASPAAPAEPANSPSVAASAPQVVSAPTVIEAAASGRGAGDTVRLYFWQAPTIVNPHLSPGTKDLSASRISYEPLASFDKDGTMVPFLAAEIPSRENGGVAADGRSVTWKLKKDVKWCDGKSFTANDVLFTYEYATNPKVGATSTATYDQVKSVEIVDDYTVKINFSDVNPAWSLPFVGNQGLILPRHIFEPYNNEKAKDAPANLVPVGTGPYCGAEFRKEDVLIIGEDVVNTIKIIYEANPYFREPDKPYFKRVELLGGGGDATKAAQLVASGAVDYSWNLQVTNDVLDQVDAGGKAKAVTLLGAFTERIMINFADPKKETADGERASVKFRHPFLTDKNVRQALAHAVDREAIARLYGRGGAITSNLLVSPSTYNSPNTTPYPYPLDLKKAAALLDAAGWKDSDGDGIRDKNGVKMSVVFQTSITPVRQGAQEIVKEAFESIGIRVDLLNIDSSIFLGPVEGTTKTRRQFYADLEEYAFSNKSPDPGAYMVGWTCAEIAQKANNWSLSNWGRYCNPAYDELYKRSTTEMNPEQRRQLIIEMNDLLIEDVALIPLVQLGMPYGVLNDIVGVDATPWDVDTWDIKDWRRT
jgi:peptide/nickel transport system substrate-binding protein